MNLSFFIFLLFCLQILYWFVGKRASKSVTGKEDYFLAGKNVKLFPLMMTFLATQVGGGLFLGAADEAYHFGWPVLLYPLGAVLGLVLLGCGIGRRLASFQVSTVAQILEVVYGSVGLKRCASILSVISLFMILVAQVIASNKFLVSLGLTNVPLFVLFWGIVIIYTTQGGLKAVISTDVVQAIFFSTVFLLCFGSVLLLDPSVASLQIPHIADFTNVSPKLCGWLLMPLLFMVIEQDMGQRCFAAASSKIVSQASLLAGVGTLVICMIPIFLGTLAHVSNLEVPQGGSVLMTMVTKTTTPWIAALIACAVLAAIISTATSLINAISSNLSNDFKLTIFQKQDPVRVAKIITCVISMGSILFAFYFDNIVDMLIQSYELSVSCLFVPILVALYKKKESANAAIGAIIGGAIGFCLFRIYPVEFPKEILSLLLSGIGYGCGKISTLNSAVEKEGAQGSGN